MGGHHDVLDDDEMLMQGTPSGNILLIILQLDAGKLDWPW